MSSSSPPPPPPPPSSNSLAAPIPDRCYSAQNLTYEQQVETFLSRCGLSQYYQTFLDEGFDRLESLLEITEADLVQMEVKRGHRRLLQRAIANARGIPANVPLNITPISNNTDLTNYPQHYQQPVPPPPPAQPPPPSTPTPPSTSQPSPTIIQPQPMTRQPTLHPPPRERQIQKAPPSKHVLPSTAESPDITTLASPSNTPNDYYPSAGTMIHNTQSGMSSTEEEAVTNDNIHRLWKRKYHRHAKPDADAPLKPPSAYVMFSNDVRAELKEQNKSFTDLARIIGDRWKNITPEEKEMYETIALKAREDYLKKVEEYQKTEGFKKYQQYISDFKAENEAAARPVGRPRKRHRRDGYVSDGTVSDSAKPQRAVSQSEDTNNKNPTDQKHYPYYLLNDEASNQSSSQPLPQQQPQKQNQFASPTLSSKKQH